jgi:hypothetical protein
LEKAAWELSQDPVAGKHLVEVLEKQGRTARAARVCMMALSAYGDDSVRAKLTHAMDRLQKKPAATENRWRGGTFLYADIADSLSP